MRTSAIPHLPHLLHPGAAVPWVIAAVVLGVIGRWLWVRARAAWSPEGASLWRVLGGLVLLVAFASGVDGLYAFSPLVFAIGALGLSLYVLKVVLDLLGRMDI